MLTKQAGHTMDFTNWAVTSCIQNKSGLSKGGQIVLAVERAQISSLCLHKYVYCQKLHCYKHGFVIKDLLRFG